MANINLFIDHLRDIIIAMPEFTAVKLSKRDIARRYNPAIKDRRPEDFPAIAIVYDFNSRERWAPIDNVNLILQIEMKDFDDVQVLAEALRDKFDQYEAVDGSLIIYKMWHNGGDPQPIFNEKHTTYWSVLKFECRIG